MLSCSFNQILVHLGGFVQFFGWYVFDGGFSSISSIGVFFHHEYIYEGVEAWSLVEGVLYRYEFSSVDAFQIFYNGIKVTFFVIQLVKEENDRFAEFFSISQMILCSYFQTILSVEHDHGSVCYIKCGNGCTYKIISTRAINEIQFLVVVFGMEYSGKYGISIFLFYGEVITGSIL